MKRNIGAILFSVILIFGDYISVLVVTSWFVQNHERTVFSPNSIFSGTHLPG